MNRKVLLTVLMLLCLRAFPFMAQESKVVRDLNLWTGITVEKTLKKDWTFSLRQEVRLEKNISTLNNYFTQIGIDYRIHRNFSLEGDYRFVRDRNADGTHETQTRFNGDLKYKGKLDFITIYYRLRYEKGVSGMKLLDPVEPYKKNLRNRLTIRYNDLRKIEPYISAEIFQLFEPHQYARYDNLRFMAGVRYEPGKSGEFNLAYGFNRELNASLPATNYLIRINYTYSF